MAFTPGANTKLYLNLNGNSLDSSGNGKNGTDTDISYGSIYGYIKQGALFNGTTSYISTAIPMTVTNNFTIFAWAYFSGTSLKGCVLSLGSLSDNLVGYSIGVGDTTFNGNGNNLIGLIDGIAWLATTRAIGTGWHMIGLQRISNQWYTVLDGVQTSFASTTNPNAPTTAAVIGANHPTHATDKRYFTGYIDEVIVEDRGWTSDELLTYFNVTVQERLFAAPRGNSVSISDETGVTI